MLQSILNKSGSLLTKIILIVIIASFALFGLGNVFIGGRQDRIAQVGDYTLTIEEYNMKVSQEMVRLRNFLNSGVPKEMLVKAISQDVFNNLINNKLVRNEADRLGIVVSDKFISRIIARNFTDRSAKFSKELFKRFLQNFRVSEKTYVDNLREEILRGEILSRFTAVSYAPQEMINAVYDYQYETRVVDIMEYPISMVKDIEPASEAELLEFYEENKEQYSTKEEKTFVYLTWDRKTIAENIEPSEEEIQDFYENNIDNFTVPEKRYVLNKIFNTKAAAEKAYKEIKEGGKFEESVDMGFIAKPELVEQETRETVFDLAEGEVSQPIESDFGWHIFKVKEIKPAKEQPLNEVKDEIVQTLKETLAEDRLYDLENQVEDALAGGATFDEVAEQFNLNADEITVVKGKKTEGVDPDIINLAFETEDESMLTKREDGGYMIVRIKEYKPSRERALDEVRGLVIKDLQNFKKRAKIKELAEQKAIEITENKSSLSSNKKTVKFKRNELKEGYPIALQKQVFSAEKGDAIASVLDEKGNFAVAIVADIQKPKEDKEKKDVIERDLKRIKKQEIMANYFNHLKNRYNVEIYREIEF